MTSEEPVTRIRLGVRLYVRFAFQGHPILCQTRTNYMQPNENMTFPEIFTINSIAHDPGQGIELGIVRVDGPLRAISLNLHCKAQMVLKHGE
jgi:hypothetical protein